MREALHIVYVADTRLPTEKAHGLALMKLCEAFAKEGAEVEVVTPKLLRLSKKDPYAYYGVEPLFPIIRIGSLDLHPLRYPKRILYFIQLLTFSMHAVFFCAKRYRGKKVVYFSHDYMPLYFLSFLKAPVYYDIHHFPGTNFMYARIMRKACSLAVQTKWKVGELRRRFDIPEERVVYWPNGTDIEDFAIDESASDARATLGLPEHAPLVMYVGQFFPWKGVDTLVRSLPYLPPHARLVLVGGGNEDKKSLLREVPEASDSRVLFVPFQRREAIPHWLRAADVLVLPNTGRQKVSLYYTSPMKLFEYMASGRPIVASRTPAILEILSDDMAYVCDPDNPEELGMAIRRVLQEPVRAAARGARARSYVRSFSWSARARALLPHLHACARTSA